MKFINRLMYNKKRAVSPVIAVILLIGLAVAASAAIFIVILPLLEPTSSIDITEGYVIYDTEYTTALDEGQGYGKGLVNVLNTGTGEVEITSIKIYWATSFAGTWTEITDAVSTQGITVNDPWVSEPISGSGDELSIRFPIPTENIDDSLSYKIILIPNEGRNLDTSRIDAIEETDMQLDADKPQISYTSTLGTIRRSKSISPTYVSDNSDVKNVTFEVFGGSSTPVQTHTITSTSAWNWNWNTYLPSSQSLSNGSYTLKMTVYDYAGLSSYVWENDTPSNTFEIDNDYIEPTIVSVIGSSVKGGIDVAEVGESYAVEANITDSGCDDSSVVSAVLSYRINTTGIQTGSSPMTKGAGDSWFTNIPAAFIDTQILADNLAFKINATDYDNNENDTRDFYADVEDTIGPNFVSHTPVVLGDEGIMIPVSATIDDKDSVASVDLWYRIYNNSGINPIGSWDSITNISGSVNTYEFQIPNYNVTLDDLQYYLVAEDPTSNLAYDGNATFPYYIDVPDNTDPVFDEWQQDIPDRITDDTDLTIRVDIQDNDRTFSWTSYESGTVTLFYDPADQPESSILMDHISGDSSTGSKIGTWEGMIKRGNFSTGAGSPVRITVTASDDLGNEISRIEDVDVIESGTPILTLDTESIDVEGSSSQNLSFKINNEASQAATATITDMQIELINSTKYDYSEGTPYLTEIKAGGSNVWVNTSTTEGANNTKHNLDSTFTIIMESFSTITLVYANSSGGYYNINDLQVNVTLFYNPGSDDTSFVFLTPITSFLFTDNWNGGTSTKWTVDSRSDGGTSFSAASQSYVGTSRGSSGQNVFTWINTGTFTIPFEVIVSFYAYSGSTNEMAFVTFATSPTDNLFLAAGARVGAGQARISHYTESTDNWNQRNSQSYSWPSDSWTLMKISIASDRIVSVYSENNDVWNLRVQYQDLTLATDLYVGLFVDYAQTGFDNFTVYTFGDAPEPPDIPNPNLALGASSLSLTQSIASINHPVQRLKLETILISTKKKY